MGRAEPSPEPWRLQEGWQDRDPGRPLLSLVASCVQVAGIPENTLKPLVPLHSRSCMMLKEETGGGETPGAAGLLPCAAGQCPAPLKPSSRERGALLECQLLLSLFLQSLPFPGSRARGVGSMCVCVYVCTNAQSHARLHVLPCWPMSNTLCAVRRL